MEYVIYKTDKQITLPSRKYFTKGDNGEDIGIISTFLATNFMCFESKTNIKVDDVIGFYFGSNLVAWVKEFQKITGLEADGNIGAKTLSKLREYGLKA